MGTGVILEGEVSLKMREGGWGIGLGFLRKEGDDGSPFLVDIYE